MTKILFSSFTHSLITGEAGIFSYYAFSQLAYFSGASHTAQPVVICNRLIAYITVTRYVKLISRQIFG